MLPAALYFITLLEWIDKLVYDGQKFTRTPVVDRYFFPNKCDSTDVVQTLGRNLSSLCTAPRPYRSTHFGDVSETNG